MKRNDDQVCLKLSRPLRVALENAAAAEGRGLSGLIRFVLIEYATKHITERAAGAEAGATR